MARENPITISCELETSNRRIFGMVEKKSELRRRRSRGKKLGKLKLKLANAKEARDRDVILGKIAIVSPWWKEPAKK
jgi:hypothetical protein